MIYSTLCILDFESCSKKPHTTQPTEIAAIMLDPVREKIIEGATFSSLIRPIMDDEEAKSLGLDPIEEKALEKTNLTREQLAEAPDLKTVWANFSKWVQSYNITGKRWEAPTLGGYNILRFDKVILDRIAGKAPYKYGPYDEDYQECSLFHPIHAIDILHDLRRTLGESAEFSFSRSISLDTVRDFFGIEKDGAHRALKDVEDTAKIVIKLLRFYRNSVQKVKFRNCFGVNPINIESEV